MRRRLLGDVPSAWGDAPRRWATVSRIAPGWICHLVLGVTSGRATEPIRALAPNAGTVDDVLALRGVRLGPSAGYRLGDAIPVTFRLGAGVFFGTAGNGRTGTFETAAGESYPVSVSESSRAIYAYVAPEARVGLRVVSRLEVSFGVAVLVMAALDQPTWVDRQIVHAGPSGQQGDGVAAFGSQSLAGSFLLTALPSLGVRYAF